MLHQKREKNWNKRFTSEMKYVKMSKLTNTGILDTPTESSYLASSNHLYFKEETHDFIRKEERNN